MTPKEKAEDLLNFYRNYRFHIPEIDCRIMASNAVNHILSVLHDSQSSAYKYWQEVEKELEVTTKTETKC